MTEDTTFGRDAEDEGGTPDTPEKSDWQRVPDPGDTMPLPLDELMMAAGEPSAKPASDHEAEQPPALAEPRQEPKPWSFAAPAAVPPEEPAPLPSPIEEQPPEEPEPATAPEEEPPAEEPQPFEQAPPAVEPEPSLPAPGEQATPEEPTPEEPATPDEEPKPAKRSAWAWPFKRRAKQTTTVEPAPPVLPAEAPPMVPAEAPPMVPAEEPLAEQPAAQEPLPQAAVEEPLPAAVAPLEQQEPAEAPPAEPGAAAEPAAPAGQSVTAVLPVAVEPPPAASAPAEPRSPYESLAEPVSPFFGDNLEEPSAPLLDERTMHPLPPLPEELENPLPDLNEVEVPEKPAGPSSLGMVARVLVLPRSTFRIVADESVGAWIAALGIVTLAAVTKAGVALGLALRGAVPGAELPAIVVRYTGAVVGPIAFAFAAAGILYGAQRWWQGDARFRVLLSVVSLALVPLVVRDFAQAVYMVARHRVLLHPGLSALVAPTGTSALGRIAYALLGQIDAFTLWSLVLLAVATVVTHGRGKLRRVLMALVVGVSLAIVASVPSFFVAPFLTR